MPPKDDLLAIADGARARLGPPTNGRIERRSPATADPLRTEPSTARTLRHWLADPAILTPPPIVVPHLAVEGRVSLLSGREKIGKSTLVGGAIADASQGRDVLGATMVAPVRALWYAIDEPVADAVRRFEALGAEPDGIVINDRPRTISELMAALECDLAAHQDVQVVVLDTLSRMLAVSGVDPNASKEVEPALARFVDFFHARNIAAILLYHTGKGGREYRGSTAIGAVVDEILTLRRRGQVEEDDFDDEVADDGRRLLVQDGRTLRGRLHLTCVGGVYQPYRDSDSLREKLLSALRDHGSARSRAELTKLAGVRKEKGLKEIAAMIAEGAILERTSRLTLPMSPSSPISPVPSGGADRQREPSLGTATVGASSPSSDRFPAGGTGPEPPSGTEHRQVNGVGSRSRNPHPGERGTDRDSRADGQLIL